MGLDGGSDGGEGFPKGSANRRGSSEFFYACVGAGQMSSPQDDVQEYQEMGSSQAAAASSSQGGLASRSQHSPEMSQSQPLERPMESDHDALSVLAGLDEVPEGQDGEVSHSQADQENQKILENFKPPDNSSPRKYWQIKKDSDVVKSEQVDSAEPEPKQRQHRPSPPKAVVKKEAPISPSFDGKRRSARLSTTRTTSTVDLKDLLDNHILNPTDTIEWEGEEGILLRDGWVEWATGTYAGLASWIVAVARHLGLKESRSLKEDVWGEVTSKGKPLSEYRKSYFDMGAPVTPKKQLHNLSRLDSNTRRTLFGSDDEGSSLYLEGSVDVDNPRRSRNAESQLDDDDIIDDEDGPIDDDDDDEDDDSERPARSRAKKSKKAKRRTESSRSQHPHPPKKSLTELENEQLLEAVKLSLEEQKRKAVQVYDYEELVPTRARPNRTGTILVGEDTPRRSPEMPSLDLVASDSVVGTSDDLIDFFNADHATPSLRPSSKRPTVNLSPENTDDVPWTSRAEARRSRPSSPQKRQGPSSPAPATSSVAPVRIKTDPWLVNLVDDNDPVTVVSPSKQKKKRPWDVVEEPNAAEDSSTTPPKKPKVQTKLSDIFAKPEPPTERPNKRPVPPPEDPMDVEIAVPEKSAPAKPIPLARTNSSGPVITSSGLRSQVLSQLNILVKKLGGTIVSEVTPQVTHLVVMPGEDGLASRTLKYLMALAKGAWVVSVQWVLDSLSNGKYVNEEDYLIKGDKTAVGGPYLAKQSSGLFDGISFHFYGPFPEPSPPSTALKELASTAGGVVLDDPPAQSTSIGELLNPTTFVICDKDCSISDAKQVLLDTGRHPISFMWIFDSLSNYRVLDWSLYKLLVEDSAGDVVLETQNSMTF